jgi:antitoxin component YwqK of YwqJK toxin-antitoxin module
MTSHSSLNCIDIKKKQERNGLVYLPNENKPFSGKFCKTELSSEENYKDGKRVGEYIEWHENGQKKSEGSYKDGKRVGEYIEWHENGQKKSEGSYKDGKKIGVSVNWDPNGRSPPLSNVIDLFLSSALVLIGLVTLVFFE